MSRYSFAAMVCLLVADNASAASADSKIESVVVYADRAQVTRVKQANCQSGTVTFSGLPSTLQPRALQANLRRGEVLGLTHREVTSGPKARAKAIHAKIGALEAKRSIAQTKRAEAVASRRKLKSFRRQLRIVWSRQTASNKAPVKRWDTALDALRAEALRAAKTIRQADVEIAQLNRERAALIAQRSLIERSRRRTTTEVTAHIRCQGSARVELSYVVPNAGWKARYEVRARSRRSDTVVIARASIWQDTGEDWRDVRVSVSSVDPRRKNIPPSIRPMYVRSRKPRDTKKILRRGRRRIHTVAAAAPHYANDAPGFFIRAAERATIIADRRAVIVELRRKRTPSRVSYEAVPKLTRHVYNRLTLRNPLGFALVPGQASLFLDGAMVGQADLERHAPGEEMALSLGANNQIHVKRYIKEEKLYRGLVSSQKIVHRYRIRVGNWTKKPRKITLLENIPVSQIADVSVTLHEKMTRPTSFNRKDGILRWELSIPARTAKNIDVAYTVAVPRNYVVRGYAVAK